MNRSIVLRTFRAGRLHAAMVVGLLAAWSSFGPATAADSGNPPRLEVEARFVHLTKTQAQKAFGDSAGKDGMFSELPPDQVRKALETLVRLKADFFGRPRLVVKTGQHAVAETVREIRYPTQFDPSEDEPGKLIPVAFETRNVGVTLEVEAFAEDGRIRLSVAPKVVRCLGFIGYHENKSIPVKEPQALSQLVKRRMAEGVMWQPVFAAQQTTKILPVESDEAISLCELPNNPVPKELGTDDVRTFVFIKARTLPVKGGVNASQPVSQ